MLLHCCYTTVYSVTTQIKNENINVSFSCVAKSSHGSLCLHTGVALAVRVVLLPLLGQQKKK